MGLSHAICMAQSTPTTRSTEEAARLPRRPWGEEGWLGGLHQGSARGGLESWLLVEESRASLASSAVKNLPAM